jgi:hypothetical protein
MIWNAGLAAVAVDNSLDDYEQNFVDSEMIDGHIWSRSCERYMVEDGSPDQDADSKDEVGQVNKDLSVAMGRLYFGTDVASHIGNYTCTVQCGKMVIDWKMLMIVQHYNNFLQK